MPESIIFACVHNAGRSQMAAAWFNHLADPAKAAAISAGTNPIDAVHGVVVDAMNEVGIDLSGAHPKRLTPELAEGSSLLVTMGCGENCPAIPGLEIRDWPLPDPKGAALEDVRVIREAIHDHVEKLLAERSWALA